MVTNSRDVFRFCLCCGKINSLLMVLNNPGVSRGFVLPVRSNLTCLTWAWPALRYTAGVQIHSTCIWQRRYRWIIKWNNNTYKSNINVMNTLVVLESIHIVFIEHVFCTLSSEDLFCYTETRFWGKHRLFNSSVQHSQFNNLQHDEPTSVSTRRISQDLEPLKEWQLLH